MRRRRAVAGAFGAGLVLLGAAQFVGPAPVNPPEDAARTLAAHVEVPPPVAATLARACADCHSNRTRWPWYSQVAPTSWLVVDHVNHGRRHLNFSEWESPGVERPREPLEAICREAREGRMPLPSYVLVHRRARLQPGEIEALCAWSDAARRRGVG